MNAVPVHIDFPDHDAIEAELDAQLGLEPIPLRERPWDCLAGEIPVACTHARISRSTEHGLSDVVCLSCGHEWVEVEGEP